MEDKLEELRSEIQSLINDRPDLDEIAGSGYGLRFTIERVPRVQGVIKSNKYEDRAGIQAHEWEQMITAEPDSIKEHVRWSTKMAHLGIKKIYKRHNKPISPSLLLGGVQNLNMYLNAISS